MAFVPLSLVIQRSLESGDCPCSSFQRKLESSSCFFARHSRVGGNPVLSLDLSCPVCPRAKASTPPTEERVTLFFTRVKKRVTRKESTCERSAPWEEPPMHSRTSRRRRVRLLPNMLNGCWLRSKRARKRSGQHCRLLRPSLTGELRSVTARTCRSSHGALCSDVLSFLVTSFFTRVKKEVTRSSAGGVEALAPKTQSERQRQKAGTGFHLSLE